MEGKTTYDARFQTPFTCICSGPSKSGKTTWVLNLLRYSDQMYTVKPAHTLFYYSAWQDIYQFMTDEHLVQEFKNECPSKEYIEELALKYTNEGGLQVIVDDMISQVNKDVADIYQITSHHFNVSVIFLTQNLFHDDKHYRSMRLNASYIVLFKNPSNTRQIVSFLNQVAPQYAKELTRVYQKVTRKGYSYMLFDLHQNTPDAIRIRARIFPHEGPCAIYVSPDASI